ncbi:MAG: hypothetical protein KGL39_20265 [Patescibacteria group bacterium]|nr:hypothetical protein [Patescibacteria group bacterium]
MIPKEQYQEWRHHPVSKVFLQFLRDKQEFLKAAALEQWVGGSDSFVSCNQTVRGQIIELGEIAELPFEAIEEFYKEKEDATEGPEANTR